MRLVGYTTTCMLIAASVTVVYAQGVPAPSAVGTVIDPFQKPLPGVPVEVTGPTGTTFVFTDETGKWSLYNLPPGDYQAKPMAADRASSANFSVHRKKLSAMFSGEPVVFDAPVVAPQIAVYGPPSVPTMLRQSPAGSLPLRAEVETSHGYAPYH